MVSFISGRADKGNLAKWQSYASDNSYHEKSNGNQAPKMQDSNKGRYTARDTNANCGPRTNYPGAKDDVNG